jgi:hypothetical protein
MADPETTISPKVSAPLVAGAIASIVTIVAAAAGVDLEVSDEGVGLLTAAVTVVLGIIGYLKRDRLRRAP